MKKQFEPQLMRLPIKVLRVDKYQKRIRENKVNNIVNNFDKSKLGVIHVSMRSDGTHFIFDGQHRIEALRRLGWDFVLCLVFQDMDYEDEAGAFVGHHDVSKPTKLEEHYARLEALDQMSLDVQSVLDELGISVVSGGGRDSLQSIGAVYEVFKRNGRTILYEVIYTIKESFGEEKNPYTQNMIKGLRDLFVEYGSKVDKKWLIKRLKRTNTHDLDLRANGFKTVHGFSKRESTKMAITQCYNHNKSDLLKLK